MMSRPRHLRPILALSLLCLGGCAKHDAPPASTTVEPSEPAWQLVALNLPSALLSIDGASDHDVYAVGADKGEGPMVMHFDGTTWKPIATGQRGDLWWVHAFPDGTALLSGAGAMVLRVAGGKVERIPTPGFARQTVYGVWGKSLDDFYAVGSAAGRNGFVWRYKDHAFKEEVLPKALPLAALGQPPGFFKAWGEGDDVWVVGSAGTVLHRRGEAPFELVPTKVKDTLFTVEGRAGKPLVVGGGSNGVVLDLSSGEPRDTSPAGAALIQGVFRAESGDWASGERGMVYTRKGQEPFHVVEHGLPLSPASSLHAIFVDGSGGIWAVGGDVLTPALDHGMMIHFGKTVPEVMTLMEGATASVEPHAPMPGASAASPVCPREVLDAGKDKSIARRWNEQILAAIRLDLPRPTVHARNLFHLSAAMWDAWGGYDDKVSGVFVNEKHKPANGDALASRRQAISFAAYGILKHRYEPAIGGPRTVACLDAVMKDLGLDAADTHDRGDDPIAFGNRIAHRIIQKTEGDGSYEAKDYTDPAAYVSPNDPLVFDNPGTKMNDPDVWQPLNLSVAATQNGIVVAAGVQTYIGSQWGGVTPFAMVRASDQVPWQDPGPIPKLGPAMKKWITEVIQKEAWLDPSDGQTLDISPAAFGHNAVGANDGKGWGKNPVTGKPYAPDVVLRADFARVMAEFWADGPKSETPPGHWNVLANQVADAPELARKLHGQGPALDPLAWDVHVYLALNGAEHDAAIAAWDDKRRFVTSRPICIIRYMGAKGQSSDPKGPAYDPEGLPLVPGLVEVVTSESSAPGQRHERLAAYVGQIAVRAWLGEPADRASQVAGVGWIRAVDWIPYQRRTFVTPAFPAFISGHSTFSRAGAEVLTALTGSPYFPGGFAEFVAPADTFLTFEKGPSREVRLQWASYGDAADQAGQSRLWGGIHIEADDFVGRRIGKRVAGTALAKAKKFFDGSAP